MMSSVARVKFIKSGVKSQYQKLFMFNFYYQNGEKQKNGKHFLGYRTEQERDYKSGQVLGIIYEGKMDCK